MTQRLLFISFLSCLFLALAIPGCGDGIVDVNCENHDQTYCTEGVTYWVDSCGNLGEVMEHCQVRCNSSQTGCEFPSCSAANCEGCCDSIGICQHGDQSVACGMGGSPCQHCGSNQCRNGTCDGQPLCSPANCTGCCNSNGICQPGTYSSACGSGGESCDICGGSEICENGNCVLAGECTTSGQTQPCGNCGTQTCQSNGQWGSCTGQGVCFPDQHGNQPCGNCGTQTRTCSSSCSWGSWDSCLGEGVCPPDEIDSRSCGDCSTESRTCTSACTWGSWGNCTGGGVCSPDQTQSQDCGNCGTEARTCNSSCSWGSWGSCTGQGTCSPDQTQSQACGNCGTETRTCNSSCSWGSWGSCTGQGVCSPYATQTQSCAGGCGSESRTCNSSCSWGSWDSCLGASEDFYFCNEWFDVPMYSVACGMTVQVFAYMFVSDSTGSAWASSQGCVQLTNVPWGDSVPLSYGCCLVDPAGCFFYEFTCTFSDGSQYPCECVLGDMTVTADTCPSETIVLVP